MWPDAFEQLQSLLMVSGTAGGGTAHVDFYLRVLCALDEEVVSFHIDRSRVETDHNSLIKVGVGIGAGVEVEVGLCFGLGCGKGIGVCSGSV